MGTACNTHMMVGYASRKFLGLTRMQKDDVPMFWKTPAPNKSQLVAVEQLACPPFSMGIDIYCTSHTSTHHPKNRESKQTAAVGKMKHATNYPQ